MQQVQNPSIIKSNLPPTLSVTKTQNVVTLTKVDPKSQEKVAEVDKVKQKQLEQKREEILQEQLLQQLQVRTNTFDGVML